MKTLLDKAKDDEADDELHQYESDDDNEVRAQPRRASVPCSKCFHTHPTGPVFAEPGFAWSGKYAQFFPGYDTSQAGGVSRF